MAFDRYGAEVVVCLWYVVEREVVEKCLEGVVAPGEVLYYGRGWSHEKQNVDGSHHNLDGYGCS